jgi:glucose/arabinose dehydrogenase
MLAFFAIVGCGAGEVESKGAANQTIQQPGLKLETVAENLEVPWAIVFDPFGRMLFTERPGRVRVYEKGKLFPEPLHTFQVTERGEMGLMGMALHPEFARNKWMYFAYGDSPSTVRVVRFTEAADGLTLETEILGGIPAAQFHAGCALSFGPDGKLYITTGDATDRSIAQDLGNLGGKTLRLNDDGSVPEDNPFVSSPGARPEIWSYGHRNAQGIAWQPGSGLMFQTEHGPSGFDGPGGGDEINIVEKGANYGWPSVHHEESRGGMVDPLLVYTPAVAPGGAAFYEGDLVFAGLRGEALIRVDLDGRKVVGQERIVEGLGRIRAVAVGPDGALYFSTSNRDGRGSPAANDDRITKVFSAD